MKGISLIFILIFLTALGANAKSNESILLHESQTEYQVQNLSNKLLGEQTSCNGDYEEVNDCRQEYVCSPHNEHDCRYERICNRRREFICKVPHHEVLGEIRADIKVNVNQDSNLPFTAKLNLQLQSSKNRRFSVRSHITESKGNVILISESKNTKKLERENGDIELQHKVNIGVFDGLKVLNPLQQMEIHSLTKEKLNVLMPKGVFPKILGANLKLYKARGWLKKVFEGDVQPKNISVKPYNHGNDLISIDLDKIVYTIHESRLKPGKTFDVEFQPILHLEKITTDARQVHISDKFLEDLSPRLEWSFPHKKILGEKLSTQIVLQ